MFSVVDSWGFLLERDHPVRSCVDSLSCYNFVTYVANRLEDDHMSLVDDHPIELALEAKIFYNHHL